MIVLRYIGYAMFFLLWVVIGLVLTFPWDVAKNRLFDQVEKESGVVLTATDLGPSWFNALKLKNLRVQPSPDTEIPIKLDEVEISAPVLKLLTGKQGGDIHAQAGGGTIDAEVMMAGDEVVAEIKIDSVEVDKVQGLQEIIKFPLEGALNLEVDLQLDKKETKNTKGRFKLSTKNLRAGEGGKLGPLPVPPLEFGDLELDVPIQSGKARFDKQTLDGTDLALSINGSMNLRFPIERSTMNLDIGIKPGDKILSADPLLKSLLMNFKRAKDKQGFYHVSVSGSIRHPRVKQGKP